MNIEDLSKSQLLLLTVLVNFVTAIATAVLTVSLLDEAPATVTQTVNRIVDHTIETVTMQVPVGQSSGTRDEDILTAAVASAASRSVTFYRESTTTPPIATGVYLSKSRAAVTLSGQNVPREVIIGFPDGSWAPASQVGSNEKLALYGFSDTADLPSAPAAAPVPVANLKQGQTAIAIDEGTAVTGIVARIDDTGIYTTLPQLSPGTAVMSLGGGLIGVADPNSVIIPGDFINSLLETPSSAP